MRMCHEKVWQLVNFMHMRCMHACMHRMRRRGGARGLTARAQYKRGPEPRHVNILKRVCVLRQLYGGIVRGAWFQGEHVLHNDNSGSDRTAVSTASS